MYRLRRLRNDERLLVRLREIAADELRVMNIMRSFFFEIPVFTPVKGSQ